MKRLHRPDLYGWSRFDPARDLDFHSTFWARRHGNVVVDPLPLDDHDVAHIERLGGVATVVLTTSDHVRAAALIQERWGAEVCGPQAERDRLPRFCDRWLSDGDEVVPGLEVLELHGSKTPGELALLLEGATLITGDLVRGPLLGRLALLPDAKLTDKGAALASVRRLEAIVGLEAVICGDGWPLVGDVRAALLELLRS